MVKITYTKSAIKSLSLYEKPLRRRIIEAIDKIPQGDIKRMKGTDNPLLFRLRIGKYRVIYHYQENIKEIIIAKIDTRGDVYK